MPLLRARTLERLKSKIASSGGGKDPAEAAKEWLRRDFPVQFFAVVRHAERADSWGAQIDGGLWVDTRDFQDR
eukprot:CAMPEP_0206517698 /NCGR_PEP_ID=MMETSP0324_2-20121206/64141_1 /ASSEMBLY_ACC=CAM_ASM_000836 /TAXON_ID=2866 /ORGANISM="Crypthecodinium cohnii, Strain Seligo" /LENGTH=72 /DNA_ID=CAMNT_0054010919 /DNA_START=288 /DNA_END=503 /DNA_ORIENTATION=-